MAAAVPQDGGSAEAVVDHWHAGDASPQAGSLVLIVTNFSLPACTRSVWHASSLRLVADGGANRLFDELPLLADPGSSPEQTRASYLPDVIAGDLDSIRGDVLTHYQNCGVPVVDLSADQDTTDLHKCVQLALATAAERRLVPPLRLVAVGALGGRLDHQLAALSLLHAFPGADITLLGVDATATLLVPGTHRLRRWTAAEEPTCGLVPLAGPAHVTTRGLKWDMDGTRLAMGHLVSTSNLLAADEVIVSTDAPLVWTTETGSE